MANIVLNVAKGRLMRYAQLPDATDSIIAVPIQTAGLPSDATFRDYATLALLLAGAADEQTTMGRKTLAGVAVTVDNSGDLQSFTATNPVWLAATGNPISALVICYVPSTGAADSAIIPMLKLDAVATPSGTNLTYVFASPGMATAA